MNPTETPLPTGLVALDESATLAPGDYLLCQAGQLRAVARDTIDGPWLGSPVAEVRRAHSDIHSAWRPHPASPVAALPRLGQHAGSASRHRWDDGPRHAETGDR